MNKSGTLFGLDYVVMKTLDYIELLRKLKEK